MITTRYNYSIFLKIVILMGLIITINMSCGSNDEDPHITITNFIVPDEIGFSEVDENFTISWDVSFESPSTTYTFKIFISNTNTKTDSDLIYSNIEQQGKNLNCLYKPASNQILSDVDGDTSYTSSSDQKKSLQQYASENVYAIGEACFTNDGNENICTEKVVSFKLKQQ
jgi:hypothetical protein